MLTIKRIKTVVTTTNNEKFGFDFPFYKGLNILTGVNSSGKTTVLSCIYYCLGMEQLLGSYNAEGLHDCLKESFAYDGKDDYQVTKSYVELEIEDDEGKEAILKRHIKTQNHKQNNIIVFQDNKKEPKFLHSKGDSGNIGGFYKWLSGFCKIELPEYEGKKILYLQHIFACAFVEQTKGWSDFFAQLPNFSTETPKPKIIEYLLDLNSLMGQFKKELFVAEEKDLKNEWKQKVKGFFHLIDNYNLYSYFPETYSASIKVDKIDKYPLHLKGDEQSISIDIVIKKLHEKLESLKKQTDVLPKQNNDKTKRLSEIQNQLSSLQKQLKDINLNKENEERKGEGYKKIIEKRKREVEALESLNKNKSLAEIQLSDVESCPVCCSPLSKEKQLKNCDKIGVLGSVAFYKSEIKLYEAYLKNSTKLIDRFEKVKIYYETELNEKILQFDELSKEIISDSRIPSRDLITQEIQLKDQLNKFGKVQQSFQLLKDELKPKAKRLDKIREEKKKLTESDKSDNDILKSLRNTYKNLLKEFGYSKELIKKVALSNKTTTKHLPVIINNESVPQPIRLKSSASDFIRALWSFYLLLLTESKRHCGFLIFDEPGQHAMDRENMKDLLKYSASIKNKQVILAISKDKSKEKQQEYSLQEIIGDLKKNSDYHINKIKDNGRSDKCVQRL